METDINATCRMQGYYHLSTKASAPGTVVAGRGRQKCSDLLELRPGFEGGTGPSACDPHRGRNRGSVLSVHLACCPPPKPPLSALLLFPEGFIGFTYEVEVFEGPVATDVGGGWQAPTQEILKIPQFRFLPRNLAVEPSTATARVQVEARGDLVVSTLTWEGTLRPISGGGSYTQYTLTQSLG